MQSLQAQTKVLATIQVTLLEPSLENFHLTCSQICCVSLKSIW